MAAAEKLQPLITPGDWFRGELLPAVFGITNEAARKYRERGVWLENKHYRKDPVGKYVYNRAAIAAWMGGQL
ncbi:excisionase family protein [Pseudomonas paralcaligenes]|uniref:excisionase family protein n=1 Tax=Pseudomonas paralcaligenes TaxID=2772558 RepID=UPI001C7F3611|nr:excisionase family protein [Pseudomonas paralcaligenes]